MKVVSRNKNLVNGFDIRDDKFAVVFSWIYEFRFVNKDIIRILLGVAERTLAEFIDLALKKQYIVQFTNIHVAANKKFYSLTQYGVDFLINRRMAFEGSKAYSNLHLRRSMNVVHNIQLQLFIINNIESFNEVIWEGNLNFPHLAHKPDCLIKIHNGALLAVEFERWSKTMPRIFHTFYQHVTNMRSGLYQGVIYVFPERDDLEKYRKLFRTDDWPLFKIKSKDSKPIRLQNTFRPSSIAGLANSFTFLMDFDKI